MEANCGQHESEYSVEEVRAKKLAVFEQRINGILEVLDSVDQGKLQLPGNARKLAFQLAKDMHSWLQSKPPTHEFENKICHIDRIMSEVMKKIIK